MRIVGSGASRFFKLIPKLIIQCILFALNIIVGFLTRLFTLIECKLNIESSNKNVINCGSAWYITMLT